MDGYKKSQNILNGLRVVIVESSRARALFCWRVRRGGRNIPRIVGDSTSCYAAMKTFLSDSFVRQRQTAPRRYTDASGVWADGGCESAPFFFFDAVSHRRTADQQKNPRTAVVFAVLSPGEFQQQLARNRRKFEQVQLSCQFRAFRNSTQLRPT